MWSSWLPPSYCCCLFPNANGATPFEKEDWSPCDDLASATKRDRGDLDLLLLFDFFLYSWFELFSCDLDLINGGDLDLDLCFELCPTGERDLIRFLLLDLERLCDLCFDDFECPLSLGLLLCGDGDRSLCLEDDLLCLVRFLSLVGDLESSLRDLTGDMEHCLWWNCPCFLLSDRDPCVRLLEDSESDPEVEALFDFIPFPYLGLLVGDGVPDDEGDADLLPLLL